MLDSITVQYLDKLSLAIDKLYSAQSTFGHIDAVYDTSCVGGFSVDEYGVDRLQDDGSILTIPYATYYSLYLQDISSVFAQVVEAIACDDFCSLGDRDNVKKLYAARCQACQDNDWLFLEKQRLLIYKDCDNLLCSIGPIEAYSDRNKGRKRFFTCVVVYKSNDSLQLLNDVTQLSMIVNESLNIDNKVVTPFVCTVMGDVISWGGEVKKLFASGRSRPEKSSLVESIGSIKQLFSDQLTIKVQEAFIPFIEQVIQKQLLSIDADIIRIFRENFWFNVFCHELGHTIGKNNVYQSNLGDLYGFFEEFRADTLGYVVFIKAYSAGFVMIQPIDYVVCGLLGARYNRKLYMLSGQREYYKYLVYRWLEVLESYQDHEDYNYDGLLNSIEYLTSSGNPNETLSYLESFCTSDRKDFLSSVLI